ncbi:hypothetical protein K1T71_008285 [Dendrolimus kikuchii]|uniref:Uncharacterized protein n=1 Tax=Dendrolimus kikuchii TaxID=765133 RepID=A0ACC1CWZ0_9NEOP|nr:hypothetical protein K1T71_008285 [Dendrolimus kikuchii]
MPSASSRQHNNITWYKYRDDIIKQRLSKNDLIAMINFQLHYNHVHHIYPMERSAVCMTDRPVVEPPYQQYTCVSAAGFVASINLVYIQLERVFYMHVLLAYHFESFDKITPMKQSNSERHGIFFKARAKTRYATIGINIAKSQDAKHKFLCSYKISLHKLKPKYRTALLKSCDEDEINCICECIHNVLQGKVPIEEKNKKKLKNYKSVLRKLVRKGVNKARKSIIIQKGGAFLPIILGAILSGLVESLVK